MRINNKKVYFDLKYLLKMYVHLKLDLCKFYKNIPDMPK